MARTTTKDGLWVETTGNKAEIGLTSELLAANKKLTMIETVGKNARLNKGDAMVLVSFGKKEVELGSPVKGKIVEVRPELAKAVTAVQSVVADPDRTWIVRVDLAASAEEEDEDEDDEDLDDEDLDDDE